MSGSWTSSSFRGEYWFATLANWSAIASACCISVMPVNSYTWTGSDFCWLCIHRILTRDWVMLWKMNFLLLAIIAGRPTLPFRWWTLDIIVKLSSVIILFSVRCACSQLSDMHTRSILCCDSSVWNSNNLLWTLRGFTLSTTGRLVLEQFCCMSWFFSLFVPPYARVAVPSITDNYWDICSFSTKIRRAFNFTWHGGV